MTPPVTPSPAPAPTPAPAPAPPQPPAAAVDQAPPPAADQPQSPPVVTATAAPSTAPDVLVMTHVAIGLRGAPCCGRAFVPRIKRTKRQGDSTRLVDTTCPYCARDLVITYEAKDGQWHPVSARDKRSGRTWSAQR